MGVAAVGARRPVWGHAPSSATPLRRCALRLLGKRRSPRCLASRFFRDAGPRPLDHIPGTSFFIPTLPGGVTTALEAVVPPFEDSSIYSQPAQTRGQEECAVGNSSGHLRRTLQIDCVCTDIRMGSTILTHRTEVECITTEAENKMMIQVVLHFSVR
ncbi:unnamed protein product, partial [Prorocentrum cordatum]